MDQKKNINLHHKENISINDIHEYHLKILQNHLNAPVLELHTHDLTGTSALITPNYIHEQKLKQSIKEREEHTTDIE